MKMAGRRSADRAPPSQVASLRPFTPSLNSTTAFLSRSHWATSSPVPGASFIATITFSMKREAARFWSSTATDFLKAPPETEVCWRASRRAAPNCESDIGRFCARAVPKRHRP